jgi:catechol 2,3-dioxygenase-like lactoylglutathione lyase family enzyme
LRRLVVVRGDDDLQGESASPAKKRADARDGPAVGSSGWSRRSYPHSFRGGKLVARPATGDGGNGWPISRTIRSRPRAQTCRRRAAAGNDRGIDLTSTATETKMIGYVTLGTNDFPRAVAFYDKLLGSLGAKRVFEVDRAIAWGTGMTSPSLGVCKPFDGKAATHGNGTMVALVVDSTDKVDSLYKLAMELGGTDEGAPGPRGEGFYAAYFRDLDGNKLNVFKMG